MARSPIHSGWRLDRANSRLDFYYRGTRVGHINATAFSTTVGLSATGALSASTTVTGGTGLSATTGDVNAVAGNVKINSPGVFSSTQPVGAAVFMTGTAPAGTITTGGAIFTDGTTMKKIIAANTVSDIQT